MRTRIQKTKESLEIIAYNQIFLVILVEALVLMIG